MFTLYYKQDEERLGWYEVVDVVNQTLSENHQSFIIIKIDWYKNYKYL